MEKWSKIIKNIAIIIVALAVIFIGWWLYNGLSKSEITIGSNKQIEVTPEKIVEIKRLGQWEFMSIMDEQIVDTIRHHYWLPDDRLTCIYYGNVRLGINLDKAPEDWVINNNDSLIVTLPAPGILDDNFIDETRTNVFFEKGSWSAYARETMYRRAKKRMMANALTDANIEAVRRSAQARFEGLFKSLGAKDVKIVFQEKKVSDF